MEFCVFILLGLKEFCWKLIKLCYKAHEVMFDLEIWPQIIVLCSCFSWLKTYIQVVFLLQREVIYIPTQQGSHVTHWEIPDITKTTLESITIENILFLIWVISLLFQLEWCHMASRTQHTSHLRVHFFMVVLQLRGQHILARLAYCFLRLQLLFNFEED